MREPDTVAGRQDEDRQVAPSRRIVRGDGAWPSQLEQLADEVPQALWLRGPGTLRALALQSVAVVGCRRATAYGRSLAFDLAAELTELGWVVFSGAAFGIDAAAHRGALEAGGATVAVLASGVDVASPRGNRDLLDRVAAAGLIVSEMPPGSVPRRHSFLVRNRLIAALTRGIVVVEAENRSGSLNTARWGVRLGRQIMAAPGSVYVSQSRGPHAWIATRQAELVTTAQEVDQQLRSLADGPAEQTVVADLRLEMALTEGPGGVGEIAARAGLPTEMVTQRLRELAAAGRCRVADGRYWGGAAH
ncbi:MAG: DNA-processing protein DprA [Actinobacteria bacterium]|nr:DNA-processing protein DprA [Actinomycetota bacterium]